MSLSFLLTSLIVVASPGTGVLYTLAAALTKGSRASIAAAFGCTLGILPAMLAAMLGLAAVLHTSALAFSALKWCGVIYLLYMATLGERGALAVDTRLGLFAASVRDRVISRPKVMRWLRRAFAGGFAMLGARLAFAER
jgi:threonine/homoserine/homoserine lactone efflux protein